MTSKNNPSAWPITLILIWVLVLCQAVTGAADPENKGPIDRKRVQDLMERVKDGEELGPEDQTYLDQARQERQKQGKSDRSAQGESDSANPRGKVMPDSIGMEGKASIGLIPLTEMSAEDRYKGEDGGLYGGGQNDPPEAHQATAKNETARIVPLDAEGKPSKEGKIALVSISMSNATQEFSFFKEIADADAEKSPLLTIVDCAQGGQAMAQWVDPEARAWTEADQRLAAADISPNQVQIAWIKLANKGPSGDLQEHGRRLQKDTLALLLNARARFPNLRIAYLGSRIYGGNAVKNLNPEPYAYEGAFPVRWLIQDQIKGDTELNYDPARGEVKAPLLLWGPYLWADGVTPRKSDGLIWEREDFVKDGTHPSPSGRKKVADLLLNFFKTDPNAKAWFLKQ